MKTLPIASGRKPRKTQVRVPLPHEPDVTSARSAPRSATCDVQEQIRSRSNAGPQTEANHAVDSNDAAGVHRHRQIEELAYNLYLQRGKEPGHALQDWLEAEKRFDTLIAEEEFGDTD